MCCVVSSFVVLAVGCSPAGGTSAGGGAQSGGGGASDGGGSSDGGGTGGGGQDAGASLGVAIGVAARGHNTCALYASGVVRCVGANDTGQLGGGASAMHANGVAPVDVGVRGAIGLTVGAGFACAVIDGGTVQCWGDDAHAELGGGHTDTCGACSRDPVTVPGLSSVLQVSAGDKHACALITGGTVICWGDDSRAQLGNGTPNDAGFITVPGVTTARLVGTGLDFSCAALTDGTLTCWGWNLYGALGGGSTMGSYDGPSPVLGLSNVTAVAGGNVGGCAAAGGALFCWGDDGYHEVGGTVMYPLPECASRTCTGTPTAIDGGSNAVSVGSGLSFNCFLTGAGVVECIGNNAHGELGRTTTESCALTGGSTICSGSLKPVTGLPPATQLAVGSWHACALVDGGVWCWGDSSDNQLGVGRGAPAPTGL